MASIRALAQLINLDAIMINTKEQFIDPKKKVFLSLGSHVIYDLPQDIQIDFLDEGISQELEKHKLIDTIENAFNVHRYTFKEIATILIDHYRNRESVEDVKSMHRSLFQAFQTAIVNGESTLGVDIGSVRAISKTGSVVAAKTVYFGVEYENELTETIYRKLPSKILGNPNINGLQSADNETLLRYFKWLGVSQYPKLILVDRIADQAESWSMYY